MLRSVAAIESIITALTNYLNDDVYFGDLTDVCFDCDLWTYGYADPVDSSTLLIPPLKTTIYNILGEIITFVDGEISSTTDYGFASQLERFSTVVKDIRNKINSIQCSGGCLDQNLLAQLLMSLVLTVTELDTSMELLNGLLTFYEKCGCLGSRFFELAMGKFINQITELQCIAQDWSILVTSFFQSSTAQAKPYVAAYVPNQPIPVPPPQQMNGFACVPCPPQPHCPPQYNTSYQTAQYGCGGAPNCIPYRPYC